MLLAAAVYEKIKPEGYNCHPRFANEGVRRAFVVYDA